MGSDIHCILEVERSGQWIFHESQKHIRFFLCNGLFCHDAIGKEDCYGFDIDHNFYSSRNYDLFTILANIRNGRGFAGCDTGDDFEALSNPKGIPDNASWQYKKLVDRWDADGHSHSYFTWKELKATEEYWNKKTKKRGMVDVEGYDYYKKTGFPPDFFILGGAEVISSNEMDVICNNEEAKKASMKCTVIEWEETYKEASGIQEIFGALEKISKEEKLTDEQMRIVFFFDN